MEKALGKPKLAPKPKISSKPDLKPRPTPLPASVNLPKNLPEKLNDSDSVLQATNKDKVIAKANSTNHAPPVVEMSNKHVCHAIVLNSDAESGPNTGNGDYDEAYDKDANCNIFMKDNSCKPDESGLNDHGSRSSLEYDDCGSIIAVDLFQDTGTGIESKSENYIPRNISDTKTNHAVEKLDSQNDVISEALPLNKGWTCIGYQFLPFVVPRTGPKPKPAFPSIVDLHQYFPDLSAVSASDEEVYEDMDSENPANELSIDEIYEDVSTYN